MSKTLTSKLEQDLDKLLEKQDQLKAMERSCQEFGKKVHEEIGVFMNAHFGLKDGQITLLEAIKKARQAQ